MQPSLRFAPPPGLADVTAELEEKLQRRRALEHSAGLAGDPRASLGARRVSQVDPSSKN